MSTAFKEKLRNVELRLNVIHFLSLCVWCWTAALLVGASILLAEKSVRFGATAPLVGSGAFVCGLAAALVIACLTRKGPADAADHFDRAFDLKQRVSTLTSLPEEILASPAGIALKEDVEKRTGELLIQEKIPIRLPKHGWAPALPLALLIGVAFLSPFQATNNKADARPAAEKQQQEKAAEKTAALARKFEQRKKDVEASSKSDEQLTELTAKVSDLAKSLSQDSKVTARDAALKLSDLAKTLEERQQRFDSLQKMKESLAKLPNMKNGPAEKLAQALKQGDFKQAAAKLDELRKKLESGALAKDEKAQLGKQLGQMQKQLKEMANLAKREEQLRKNITDKDVLKKELEKLAQDAKKMEKLSQLAAQLEKCAKCLDGQKSTEANKADLTKAMKAAEEVMEQLATDEKSRQMMNQMLDDLAEARNSMMINDDEPKNGRGAFDKSGAGAGLRDEAPDDTKSRLVKAEVKQNKGRVYVTGLGDGKSFRGDSKLEIKAMAAQAAKAADESVTRQKVPEEYRKHTLEYFDRLNRGLD